MEKNKKITLNGILQGMCVSTYILTCNIQRITKLKYLIFTHDKQKKQQIYFLMININSGKILFLINSFLPYPVNTNH